MLTDDNVGNLRRLPTAEERRQRSGGFGIYYHIDMHGGPYAYQWVNTNPFPKMAEQMTIIIVCSQSICAAICVAGLA